MWFLSSLVTDEADHVIGTEPMQVIWARGQEPGRYVHSPPSALETEAVRIADFYRPDELKYHGKQGQRGVTVITFLGTAKKKKDDRGSRRQSGDR